MSRTPCEQANRSLLQVWTTTAWTVGMVFCAVSSVHAFTPGILPGENCDAPGRPSCDFAQRHLSGHYQEIHQLITEGAFNDVRFTSPSGDTLLFSDQALNEIENANAKTDYAQGAGTEVFHFDSAFLAQSSEFLRKGRNYLLSRLQQPSTLATSDAKVLRALLGVYLHTLQDFYAHSNYVNLSAPLPNALDFVTAPTPGSTGPGITVLAPQPPGTNPCVWGVPLPVGDTQERGLTTDAKKSLLTTGWAEGNLQLEWAPTGQCAHGFLGNGIHKDWYGRDRFRDAYKFAVAASTQFVQSITNDSSITNKDNVCMLMTDKPCEKPVSNCQDPDPNILGHVGTQFAAQDQSQPVLSLNLDDGFGGKASATGGKGNVKIEASFSANKMHDWGGASASYREYFVVSSPGKSGSGVATITLSPAGSTGVTCAENDGLGQPGTQAGAFGNLLGGVIGNPSAPAFDIRQICPAANVIVQPLPTTGTISFVYGQAQSFEVRLLAYAQFWQTTQPTSMATATSGMGYSVTVEGDPGATISFCRTNQ